MQPPRSMRAVLLTGHGGPERLEYRCDVPVPVPAAGEVLIRVGAAAVNNTDINTRIGWYSRSGGAADAAWTGTALRFPFIQGADAAGHVVAVGAGVDPARVGERVLVNPVLEGGTYFGSDRDGAFAQYCTVPAVNAVHIDCTLSDVELASFPCSYGAAEHMLTRTGLAAGETVLITGASGGVGSAAVQLARRRGARVIAQAAEGKGAAVRALGAERVIGREADLVQSLGAESVDAVIDVVGGAAFPRLIEVLRRGGRYAVAGAIGGPVVELDLRKLYLKDLRVHGCTIFDGEVFAALVRYIERGEIRPLVSATYPLEQIAAAQAAFLEKRHTGKIVLVP